MTDLSFEPTAQLGCRISIGVQIEMLDFLPDNPICHRVDIIANNITSDTVRFQEGRATPHERVGDPYSLQVMRLAKCFPHRSFDEL